MIYETDTDLTYIYGGSAWQQISGGTAVGNSGLVYVTSVTVGTGVSSVTINNCFNSTYENYRILISNIDGNTDGAVLSAQLSSGGTASTTGYAGNTFYVSTGSASGLTNAPLGATYWEAMSISNASTGATAFDLFQPFLAAYSRIFFQASCDNSYFRFGAGINTAATSYDGIKINGVSTTMTGGTIAVYGYRKV
jgi:hypothetical protein